MNGYYLTPLGEPNDRKTTWTLHGTGYWPLSRQGALNDAIRKWEAIVAFHVQFGTRKIANADSSTCALCQRYMDVVAETCDGCPIKALTGEDQCRETPYFEYRRLHNLRTAQAMLDFVKSIRAADLTRAQKRRRDEDLGVLMDIVDPPMLQLQSDDGP